MIISDLLPCEGERSVTQLELERLTGIDSRSIRGMIQKERLSGAPIISGRYGYRLSESADDVERCGKALQHRGLEVLRVSEAMLCTADRLRGQERMEGF